VEVSLRALKNDKYRVVYFAMPKVACISIVGTLSGKQPPDKITNCNAKSYPDYTWFTFVRHPLARNLSLHFHMQTLHSEGEPDMRPKRLGFQGIPSLDEFLEAIPEMGEKMDDHVRPQTQIVAVESLDFIGKFENLREDWAKLGMPPLSAHWGRTKHKPWAEYFYDDDVIKPVARKLEDLYREDLEVFNYPVLPETKAELNGGSWVNQCQQQGQGTGRIKNLPSHPSETAGKRRR
jgi:hypothetical protein